MSIGSHQSARMINDEWLTPPHILHALGTFDLDPCAPIKRPWETAQQHYTIMDNGLHRPWHGRIWLNPPYGQQARKWTARMADHNNGIALLFARTETEMFMQHVWPHATALLFIAGRLHFHYVDGTRHASNAGAPSVLIAYNESNAQRLVDSRIPGALVINPVVQQ